MSIFSSKPSDQTLLSKVYPSINKNYKQSVLNRIKDLTKGPKEHLSIMPTIPNVELGIGLELELEKIKWKSPEIHDTMVSGGVLASVPASSFFFVTDDHSLRNNGKEFISKIGLNGQQVLAGVKYLLDDHTTPLASVPDPSYRTSMHVHVNVLDFTIDEVKKVVLWYALLEPMFFNMSGNRNKNIFCVPLKDTYFSLKKILNSEVKLSPESLQDSYISFEWAINKWMKYCALNILPIRAIGTIEFRHHAGTINYSEIENWILFLYQFVIGAKGEKGQTLSDCFDEIVSRWHNNTLNQFIENKFGIYDFDVSELDSHIGNILTKVFDISDFAEKDFEEKLEDKSSKKKVVVIENTPTDFSSINLAQFLSPSIFTGSSPTDSWSFNPFPPLDSPQQGA